MSEGINSTSPVTASRYDNGQSNYSVSDMGNMYQDKQSGQNFKLSSETLITNIVYVKNDLTSTPKIGN